jgi:DNA-binding transcriptional LysR family regulator
MEAQALALSGSLRDTTTGPRGQVRIATMYWVTTAVLIPHLPAFIDRFPEIEIELIATTRERSLSRREAEMALRFEMPPRDREVSLDLASFGYAAYAPKGINPAILPWICFGEDVVRTAPGRWVGQQMSANSRPPLRVNDVGMIHDAVRAGIGKGLLPEVLGDSDPDLVRVSGDRPEMARMLRALIHFDVRHDTAVTTVLDWLRQVISHVAAAPRRQRD